MGIAAGIDKAIAVIAPQAALKRTVARQKMQILDSGYGNYGASVTKKRWEFHQKNAGTLKKRLKKSGLSGLKAMIAICQG